MTKKRKRKPGQVNFLISKQGNPYYKGFLIISRGHPLFKNPPLSIEAADYDLFYPWSLESYKGNEIYVGYSGIKKKFRNLNYRIFIIRKGWFTDVPKEEIREKLLQVRWKMIEAYIKHKRGI